MSLALDADKEGGRLEHPIACGDLQAEKVRTLFQLSSSTRARYPVGSSHKANQKILRRNHGEG